MSDIKENNSGQQTSSSNYSVPQFQRLFPKLLAHCDSDDVEVLLNTFQPLAELEPGKIIIRQNELSNSFYIVCGGLLAVVLEGEGKHFNLGMISRGQWVGDVSLIEPGPASATVSVLEKTRLMRLTKNELDELRTRHPRTAARLLNALSMELANRMRVSSQMAMSIAEHPEIDIRGNNADSQALKWITNLGRWLSGIKHDEMEQFAKEELQMQRMELEQKYKHLYQQEKENLLIEERERILAELHDGVGGQLVAMLAMLENRKVQPSELKDTVRAALDDLRLMIDSLDSIEGDIPVVLGMFRSRMESRLNAQNMEFDWQVTDLPPVPALGPHEVLQLLRILQEAVTNIIKHANADTISVKTFFEKSGEKSGVINIAVQDNGGGISEPYKYRGHGMQSMHRRALDLGGSLDIKTGDSGTEVIIKIPVYTAGD